MTTEASAGEIARRMVEKLRLQAAFFDDRPTVDETKGIPSLEEMSDREAAAEAAMLREAADLLAKVTAERDAAREANCKGAEAELSTLRAELARVKEAWEQLPEGNYSPPMIEWWLRRYMKPAMDSARAVLEPKP